MEQDLIIKNNTNYEKTILVIGVFHGDEEAGEYFINQYLEKNCPCGKNRMFFVPRLNKTSTRKNKNGVDLNRNFPTANWAKTDVTSDYYGGKSAGSEDETKFLIELIKNNEFDAIITIHSPFKIINYDCAKNCPITPELAEKISDILGYPVQKDIGYPTHGSFGTYCGIEREIPTITIEIDEEVPPKQLLPKFSKLFEYLENNF